MAGVVVLEPVSIAVVPGETAVTSVRVRNTGAVVDQFTVSVVGQPAAWTTVAPIVISLFPGAEGTVNLHVAPPRAPGVGLGPVPFGVRVVAASDADLSVVEEGEVDLRPFVDLTAKLTPRTTETKRRARHEVLLDNRGNASVEAEIEAGDPDEHLAFDVRPRLVTVEGGHTARVALNVAARTGFARGPQKHRPFQVAVTAGADRPPILLDGALVQKGSMPKFVVPLITAVVLLGAAALVLPGLLKGDEAASNLQTAVETTTTTTEAVTTTEAPVEDAAATEAEAKAAAEAELAANGKDPNAPGDTGGTGGTSTASDTGPAESPTTTARQSSTQPSDFIGEWVNVDQTKSPQAFRISASENVFRIDIEESSTTPFDDANDGTIVFTIGSPEEKHTMSITRDGRLVDVITTSTGASRSLVFTRR